MISAHQYTISDVLGDKFLHEVPPYQRPYAWTKVQATQLLMDLVEAADSDSREPYFLGSIVLIRGRDELIGQVVDGQQRLTTLTILAAVLRDIATDLQEVEALASVVYIEPNQFKGQQEAVRVLAHERDRLFFRDVIQKPGATKGVAAHPQYKNAAQRLMLENATALREIALEMSEAKRQALVTFLLKNSVIVVVTTESRSAALRIFKVLNDRGLDLSNADVIKADLLSKFSNEDEMARHAERWRQLESDLGRDEFEGVLETLRFIREEVKNRRTLSEAYSARFRTASVGETRQFLEEDLAAAAEVYGKILDADATDFPVSIRQAATEALNGLVLVPNRDWVPAAVATIVRLGYSEPSVDVLERLEGLAWIMQLGRRYDNDRINRYVSVLKALPIGGSNLVDALSPTAEEAQDAWSALNGPLYDRFPTRVVRALLERLDRIIAEQPVVWDGQKTVEHILPQNPKDGAWDTFTPEHRFALTNTLGNLVILTSRKNSSASNYAFTDKKNVYFGVGPNTGKKRATYASAQELAHVADWNLEEYTRRHDRHTKLLADRWHISHALRNPLSA